MLATALLSLSRASACAILSTTVSTWREPCLPPRTRFLCGRTESVTPQRLKQPIPTAKSLIFQMQCLNSLNEKFAGLSGAASLPESGNVTGKPSSADFCTVS